ncbi:MAG: PEP-CTERM sorting domain-containing protein, partial [Pirellulales bacterium]|nr:PEP-CTERM sorting domain-containing protein [Pirellulales bacterium]
NQPSVPPADNNITVPVKRFDNVGSIDIQFAVVPDNGVTEYSVFESIDNNTGIDWSSYIMELGFYDANKNFVPSVLGDGLDFDLPTLDLPPVSTAFVNVAVPNEDQLVFSGGVHSTGAEIYQIRIDVPSNLEPTGVALGSFVLRQAVVPVPEPGTLAMAALIGLALSAIGLRKRWG